MAGLWSGSGVLEMRGATVGLLCNQVIKWMLSQEVRGLRYKQYVRSLGIHELAYEIVFPCPLLQNGPTILNSYFHFHYSICLHWSSICLIVF